MDYISILVIGLVAGFFMGKNWEKSKNVGF